MLEAPSGKCFHDPFYAASHDHVSVTAIADKLGLDFALIHKKRNTKIKDAPEKMELLVGDVRDKV